MLWGEAGHMIYNDGYALFAGDRHPWQLGKPVLEGWPEVADFNANVMKTGLSGGTLQYKDQELTLFRNGGAPEQVFVNLDYSPVSDDHGKPAGVLAIVIETTERVKAERRLAAEHNRLIQLFDQAPTFKAMLTGPEHRFALTNPPYDRLIGGRSVAGQTVADALPEADEQGFLELLNRVRRDKQTFRGERMLYSIPQTEFAPARHEYVDFIYQPLFDDAGEVDGIFVEGIEVTSQVEADRALRESEARFRNMADHAPVMMWVTKADGTCTYLNKAWYQLTGQSEAAALGFGWLDATHPDDRARAEAAFLDANATQQPFHVEYRLRDADGGYRWAIDAAAPRFGDDGVFLGFVGSVVDIDARHQAELATERANKVLETANVELEREVSRAVAEREAMLARLYEAQKLETLGQLTGGVAHDFNNLLTPIMAALDLVERRAGLDDKIARLVAGALQAAERAKLLIQRLRAFGRRQTLDVQPIDLPSLISEMRSLIERTVGSDVDVKIDIADTVGLVRGDHTQLELAVLNLCANAADAMFEGGQLTISAAPTSGRAADGKPLVALTIEDNGQGMREDVLHRATEPFFTTKDVSQGTGLCLSMVDGLAAQLGGRLELKSRLGHGTSATLLLVAAEEQTRPPLPACDCASARAQSTVLLVDDEVLVRMALAATLEEAGYEVLEAGSANDALSMIESNDVPDLLITDHLMPGMTGAALAAQVRQTYPGLPILMITGYANLTDDERAGIEVIGKPVRLDELAERIAKLLASAPGTVVGTP